MKTKTNKTPTPNKINPTKESLLTNLITEPISEKITTTIEIILIIENGLESIKLFSLDHFA